MKSCAHIILYTLIIRVYMLWNKHKVYITYPYGPPQTFMCLPHHPETATFLSPRELLQFSGPTFQHPLVVIYDQSIMYIYYFQVSTQRATECYTTRCTIQIMTNISWTEVMRTSTILIGGRGVSLCGSPHNYR